MVCLLTTTDLPLRIMSTTSAASASVPQYPYVLAILLQAECLFRSSTPQKSIIRRRARPAKSFKCSRRFFDNVNRAFGGSDDCAIVWSTVLRRWLVVANQNCTAQVHESVTNSSMEMMVE